MVCSIGRAPLIFSCNLPVSASFDTTSKELDEGMKTGELEETKVECSKGVLLNNPELDGVNSIFGNGFVALENDEEGCG
jgi:hypothetical protein